MSLSQVMAIYGFHKLSITMTRPNLQTNPDSKPECDGFFQKLMFSLKLTGMKNTMF
jgi:hypothetical protein